VRFIEHVNYPDKSNLVLQRSSDKHGWESFSFDIIELCDPAVLLEREQVWLNILFSTFASALIYNIARDALAPFTGRTHSAETKAAISEAMSGENHPYYGKSHSPETKAAMSEAHKGKTLSSETPRKGGGAAISDAMKGNTNRALSVYVYDSENVLVDSFPTYTAAAEFLGVTQGRVSQLVKSGGRTQKGYRVTTTPLT
jgi:group I intron endonuclease